MPFRKFLFVLLAGSLLGLPVKAQYDYFVYDAGRFVPGMHVYTFVENADLKVQPGMGHRTVITISAGSRVVIMANTMKQSERNGIKQYWYQVGYTNDSGAVFRGFLEGHDLAVAALRFQVDYQRDLMLAQITGNDDDGSYILTAHVLRAGNHIVHSANIPFLPFVANPALPEYSFALERNIQTQIMPEAEVAELKYYHANDSMPAGILYLLWNGEQLVKLCDAIHMTETGRQIREVTMVYPGREGVEPGSFMIKETISPYNPAQKTYGPPHQTLTTYGWDGEQFNLQISR